MPLSLVEHLCYYGCMNEEKEVQNRKRGGQPGNQNARTHGFYARVLSPRDREVLQAAASLNGLDQEIALLRMKILSIISNTPDNHAVLLLAVTALTRALKARHQILKDNPQEIAVAIANVFRDINLPLGLDPTQLVLLPLPSLGAETKPGEAGGKTETG